jgi:RHS repeat-associated protein
MLKRQPKHKTVIKTELIYVSLIFSPTNAKTENCMTRLLYFIIILLFHPFSLLAQQPNKAFGVIDDSYTVNSAGAYNHIVPLMVPPGINGLAPNLALVYDSRSGISEMGYGWALSGLSKITRSGNNFAQHGTIETISFTSKDAFLLDGQYLSCMQGPNGGSNSQYRTENETFSIIWSKESASNNSDASPRYFVVKQANGLKYYYGSKGPDDPSDDSRLLVNLPSGKSEVLEWHVKKIEDTYGNFMEFEYKQNGINAIRIESISYTGNKNIQLEPTNKIVFRYFDPSFEKVRSANVGYISGVSFKNENLLKTIGIMTNGQFFKFYHFEYDQSTNDHLISIKESTDQKGENHLPETKITWTNKSTINFTEKSYRLIKTPENLSEIDLNSDGQMEYVSFKKNPQGSAFGSMPPFSDNLNVYKKVVTTTGKIDFSEVYSLVIKREENTDVDPSKYVFADVDGDSRLDLITSEFIYSNCSDENNFLFDLTLENLTLNIVWNDFKDFNRGALKKGNGVMIAADMDGNGKSEIVVVDNEKKKIAIYGWETGKYFRQLYTIEKPTAYKMVVQKLDLMNSGKEEIIILKSMTLVAEKISIRNGKIEVAPFNLPTTLDPPSAHLIKFVDFNLDGILDVCLDKPGEKLKIWINTGNKFINQVAFETPFIFSGPAANPNFHRAFIGQFNSQKNLQVLTINDNTFKLWNVVFEKTNNLMFEPANMNVEFPSYITKQGQIQFMDFDNDGDADIKWERSGTDFKNYFDYYINPNDFQNKISSVTDGFGNEVSVNFSTLEDTTVYKCNLEKLKSNYSYYSGLYIVVKELYYSNGLINNGKNSKSYSYKNLIYEKTGRGLSGFVLFNEKDNTNGISTQTQYEYHFPLTGKILSQTKTSDKGIELFQLKNNWSFQTYDDEVGLINKFGNIEVIDSTKTSQFIDKQKTHNLLVSRNLLNDLQKDINTNIIEIDYPDFSKNSQTYVDPNSILKAVISLNTSKKTYVPILLEASIQKNELDGVMVSSSKILYEYDAFGYVTKTEQHIGNGTILVNTRKNLHINLNHNENATYILGLVTSDNSFVYVDSYDERNGQKTEVRTNDFAYNKTTGALIEKIRQKDNNQFKHITSFDYDNTGNIIAKKYFPKSENEIKEEYIYSEDRRFVKEFINPLGYKTFYEYDVKFGAKTFEINEDSLWVKNDYDGFGLLLKTSFKDGRFISYSYKLIDNTSDNLFKSNEIAAYKITITEAGSEPIETYYDKIGREIASVYSLLDSTLKYPAVEDLVSRKVIKAQQYNESGNLIIDHKPFYASIQKGLDTPVSELCLETYDDRSLYNFTTEFNYDPLNRPIATTLADGLEFKSENFARKKINYNTQNQKRTEYYNHKGELITVSDDQNNFLNYEYDLWGNIIKIISPNGQIIESQYDLIGRKIRLKDPNIGIVTYKYDSFDRVIEEKTGDRVVNLDYDKLNRLVKRTTQEGSVIWKYDKQIIGKVDSIIDASGNITAYEYDDFARIASESQYIKSKVYKNTFTYDNFSRLETKTFPKGFKLKYDYINNIPAKISEIKTDNTLKTIWELIDVNAEGQILERKYGNDLKTSYKYDVFSNLLLSINTSRTSNSSPRIENHCNSENINNFYNYPIPYQPNEQYYEDDIFRVDLFTKNLKNRQIGLSSYLSNNSLLQNLSFEYDNNYNLKTKVDSINKIVEGYVYDNINRLTQVLSPKDDKTLILKYDVNGNILLKSDVGVYEYDNDKQQQLKSISKNGQLAYDFIYDQYGNVVEEKIKALRIEYTSYNKPISITNNLHKSDFKYGYNNQQIEAYYFNNNAHEKSVMTPFSDFEVEIKDNNEVYLNYVMVGNNLIAIHYQESDSTSYNHYIHKDQLGSIQLVTDDDGNKVVEYNYSAFGQRTIISGNASATDKGFTAHQHLDEFELINAAARLYSPAIGRFLSADPFVQSPSDLQSLNRYSYVGNNPLNNIDPSGFWGIKIRAPRIKWNPGRDISRGINNVGRAVGKAHEDIYNEGDRFIDKNGKQIVVVAAAVAITYFSGGALSGVSAPMMTGLSGAMINGAILGASMAGGMTDITAPTRNWRFSG